MFKRLISGSCGFSIWGCNMQYLVLPYTSPRVEKKCSKTYLVWILWPMGPRGAPGGAVEYAGATYPTLDFHTIISTTGIPQYLSRCRLYEYMHSA